MLVEQSSESALTQAPAPAIAVVIPTYNRAGHLLICLRHLEAQTFKGFEVVIVDDGSSDDTIARLEGFMATSALDVRIERQRNSGPARARNRAVRLLRAPVCIFIGDDIFPAPDFVEQHAVFHAAHPQLAACALGWTQWAKKGQRVTRLMRWLDSDGLQFAYKPLLQGQPPDWHHFYTSNLSMKTQLVLDNPFHEGFRLAGMEDIELGYRLHKSGQLQLSFLPNAIAEHLHPTSFMQTCKRAVGIGEMLYLFEDMWPEQRSPGPQGFRRQLLLFLTRSSFLMSLIRHVLRLYTLVRGPSSSMLLLFGLHIFQGREIGAHLKRQAAGLNQPISSPDQQPSVR